MGILNAGSQREGKLLSVIKSIILDLVTYYPAKSKEHSPWVNKVGALRKSWEMKQSEYNITDSEQTVQNKALKER